MGAAGVTAPIHLASLIDIVCVESISFVYKMANVCLQLLNKCLNNSGSSQLISRYMLQMGLNYFCLKYCFACIIIFKINAPFDK